MVWSKTASNYVASWRFFILRGGSLARLAVVGFALGLVWGVLVVKVHGLPGQDKRDMFKESRDMRKNWDDRERDAAKLKSQMCRDFPTSKACQ